MKAATTQRPGRQHGVATVELVFMIIWMWFLGVAMFALLNYLYQYTTTRHATQAAAAYVASIPHAQLYNGTEILATRTVVQRIVRDTIGGAGIATPEILDISFYCGGINDWCREREAQPGLPIHIRAEYSFTDPFWRAQGFSAGGNSGGQEYWEVEVNSSAVFLR